MMPAAYRKFPAWSAARAGFSIAHTSWSLWIGEDHLLHLGRTGFLVDLHESYKRFYFGDIRAVTVERTSDWLRRALVSGVLGLGGAVAVFQVWADEYWIASSLLIPVVLWFLGKAAFSVVWGPSCVCRIHTAVQTEEIPCLNRLAKVERFLTAMRPLIESAQGLMALDEILERGRSFPAAQSRKVSGSAPPVRHDSGVLHVTLFTLFLGSTLLDFRAAFSNDGLTAALNLGCGLAAFLAIVAGLIRQAGSDLSPALKKAAWIAAVYFLAIMGCYTIISTFSFFLDVKLARPGDQWERIKTLSNQLYIQTSWFKGFLTVQILLGGLIGAYGLALALGHRLRSKPAGSLPSSAS